MSASVVRVFDENGSHIEPPLDESWSDLEKLQWHAAVVANDTGLRVSVRQAERLHRKKWVPDPGMYSVGVGSSSLSAMPFSSAWTFLIGVSVGGEQARRA